MIVNSEASNHSPGNPKQGVFVFDGILIIIIIVISMIIITELDKCLKGTGREKYSNQ